MDASAAKIVFLVADGYEDSELEEPLEFFREHDAGITVAGVEPGTVRGKKDTHSVEVEAPVSDLDPAGFDALVIPGGNAPETLRLDEDVLAFTRHFFDEEKTVGAICHGAQVLISADVLDGRRATCWPGIRDDVINAGADYEDAEVVVDGSLVTSRKPADIPAFDEALLRLLESDVASEGRETVAVS